MGEFIDPPRPEDPKDSEKKRFGRCNCGVVLELNFGRLPDHGWDVSQGSEEQWIMWCQSFLMNTFIKEEN